MQTGGKRRGDGKRCARAVDVDHGAAPLQSGGHDDRQALRRGEGYARPHAADVDLGQMVGIDRKAAQKLDPSALNRSGGMDGGDAGRHARSYVSSSSTFQYR